MGSAADRLSDLVRAYAFSELPALGDAERTRWKERYAALSADLGLVLPPKLEFGNQVTWRTTMGSLRMLRTAMQDASGSLEVRYAQEERRLVDAYAEAHVAVLRAVIGRGEP